MSLIVKRKIKLLLIVFVIISVTISGCISERGTTEVVKDTTEQKDTVTTEEIAGPTKLYWFIPDGMRADPDLFNIFQWAEEGKLPNIKRMMDNGAYGFSIPTFPSHTPTNFATLFTGTYPEKHGVADGPMHTEGNPLSKVSVGGFSSAAKKITPIWVTQERDYDKKIVLLSVPGTTPPELEEGITIHGRWGGWGADFPATIFERESKDRILEQGRGSRLFFFGPKLTQYLQTEEPKDWINSPKSFSPPMEVSLNNNGVEVFAYIQDKTDNNIVDYDKIVFSFDKNERIAKLKQGEWSEWLPITLTWKVGEKQTPVETSFKINVIKLDDDGFFRIRFFYSNLNEHMTKPSYVADEIITGVGPMMDFVDNFPPQLIYYTEDKTTFYEEAKMTLDWHKKATSFILQNYDPDIYIGDIYTPNQMLTSRWWMGYIDPSSARYDDVSNMEREQLWKEVNKVYLKLDDIVGELLDHADENTIVVLSSDHGAVPLDKWVRLNNLFAEKGWLKFEINPDTGEPVIDWENSTVVYLKMAHVYIHPDGLGGKWKRASGEDYEKLRDEVRAALLELEDPETGIKPLIEAYPWEDVEEFLDLPTDRVGDLVLVNKAGYGWNEEMTEDKQLFDIPLKTGYKQAILAKQEMGMWTPFIIMGPGVKKGYNIKNPIQGVDQYPTITTLLGSEIPDFVQGRVLNEVME